MGKLKFTVITPSYNQGEYIEKTITSVLDQKGSNFEHIVIDGGSTDKTLSVLEKYPHLKIVSEKDEGQSDAVNKGLKMASGDIIAWINSDDWYEPCAFKYVEDFFLKNQDKNIVMGDCNLVDHQGVIFNKVINYERSHAQLRKYWIGQSIPTQPAIFFRNELIEKFGYLDMSLHYAMDYDLWMRFSTMHRFYHIEHIVSNYRFHPAAKGGDHNWKKFEPEWDLVYKRHVGMRHKVIDALLRSMKSLNI